MAYNSNYSNNRNADKPFEPTVYSPYRFNNAESEIDKTCLHFDVWNKSLKISIYPRKDGEEIQFDKEKGVSVYLNHTKAAIFASEIRNFLKDPVNYSGVGVNAGQGVITISNGTELGYNNPVLIIRKLDDTGTVLASFAYEFKSNFWFSIRNYTGGVDFVKNYEDYKSVEIEEMLLLLDEYCKAMTYMVAYSVLDTNKRNNDFISKRLSAIAEKLGIETFNRSGSKNYSNASSFFNNAGTVSGSEDGGGYIPPATIDDID